MTKVITIELDADVIEATVGGKTYQHALADIHGKAAVKIFQYGFQRFINDKTGGKTPDEKERIVAQALADIKAGTVQRTTRTADPLVKYRRNIIRDQVRETDGYKNAADRNAYLDEFYRLLIPAQVDAVDKHAAKLKEIDDKAKAAVADLDIKLDF
jgi:hypothetical protein